MDGDRLRLAGYSLGHFWVDFSCVAALGCVLVAGGWLMTGIPLLAAVTVEGWLFRTRSDIRFPWAFALCANLFSFTIGLLF